MLGVSRSGTALLPRRHSRMIVVVSTSSAPGSRRPSPQSYLYFVVMGGRQVNVRTRPDREPTGPSLDVIVDALLTDGPVLLGSCGEGLRCRRLPGVRTHQRRLQQSAALCRKYCQERRALAESASVMRWPWSPIRVPSHLAGPPGGVGTLPVASPNLSVRSSRHVLPELWGEVNEPDGNQHHHPHRVGSGYTPRVDPRGQRRAVGRRLPEQRIR